MTWPGLFSGVADTVAHTVIATAMLVAAIEGAALAYYSHQRRVSVVLLRGELLLIVIALAQWFVFDMVSDIVSFDVAVLWSRWSRLWTAVVFVYIFASQLRRLHGRPR